MNRKNSARIEERDVLDDTQLLGVIIWLFVLLQIALAATKSIC